MSMDENFEVNNGIEEINLPSIPEAGDDEFIIGGDEPDDTGATGTDEPAGGEPTPDNVPAKEETPKKSETWDKERQRADQAEANLRKAQERLRTMESDAASAHETAKSLQDRLDGILQENAVKIEDIDEDINDPKLLEYIKSMKIQIDRANERSDRLEKVASDYVDAEKAKQAEASKEEAKSEIIADIEGDFPAKYRNQALEKANEICTARGFAPKDRYEAAKILRTCYKELADADKGKTAPSANKGKTSVPTDSGKGGLNVVKTEPPKAGALRDLAAEWRQKLKRSG